MSFSNFEEVKQIKIPNIDKLVHFVLYTTLSFLWMWGLVKKNKPNSFFKYAVLIFIIGSSFGVLIEFLQENFTQTRSAEILDVVCNCIGILTGIILKKIIS